MKMMAGILARVVWEWLFWDDENVLREPSADYGGLLDGMEASELLALLEKVQERLNELHRSALYASLPHSPVTLFIDKSYNIRLGSPNGTPLPLRPLVKSVFILFLKHPEGILLKERAAYESELNSRLGAFFKDFAGSYQIQGANGHLRRIPLDPLLVCWEDNEET